MHLAEIRKPLPHSQPLCVACFLTSHLWHFLAQKCFQTWGDRSGNSWFMMSDCAAISMVRGVALGLIPMLLIHWNSSLRKSWGYKNTCVGSDVCQPFCNILPFFFAMIHFLPNHWCLGRVKSCHLQSLEKSASVAVEKFPVVSWSGQRSSCTESCKSAFVYWKSFQWCLGQAKGFLPQNLEQVQVWLWRSFQWCFGQVKDFHRHSFEKVPVFFEKFPMVFWSGGRFSSAEPWKSASVVVENVQCCFDLALIQVWTLCDVTLQEVSHWRPCLRNGWCGFGPSQHLSIFFNKQMFGQTIQKYMNNIVQQQLINKKRWCGSASRSVKNVQSCNKPSTELQLLFGKETKILILLICARKSENNCETTSRHQQYVFRIKYAEVHSPLGASKFWSPNKQRNAGAVQHLELWNHSRLQQTRALWTWIPAHQKLEGKKPINDLRGESENLGSTSRHQQYFLYKIKYAKLCSPLGMSKLWNPN